MTILRTTIIILALALAASATSVSITSPVNAGAVAAADSQWFGGTVRLPSITTPSSRNTTDVADNINGYQWQGASGGEVQASSDAVLTYTDDSDIVANASALEFLAAGSVTELGGGSSAGGGRDDRDDDPDCPPPLPQVPEPSTYVMMGGGLLALAWSMRRRAKI
jgi:hypothetical protein